MYMFIKKYKICSFEFDCFKKSLFEFDPDIYMTRKQLNNILGHKKARKGLYILEYWYKDIFSKFKLNLRAPNKSENKFEKIDSIIFEFDDYEQLKNVIINGENLNLSAGKLKVLRDIRKSKGLDEIGSNSLSSQVSKINSAFKEFQKQHGIFDTKHLINPKNDEGMYTINDDFCSLIKKERKKLLRKINCWQ